MCGIVGYTGTLDCVDILLKGLTRLEYRGYDSAGLAVIDGEKIDIRKAKGRLSNLTKLVEKSPIKGQTGIGHTRWATHGEPSDINSHPHIDANGQIAIVHNGIIENYYALRKGLEQKGIRFITETDTEVVVQLLGYYYTGDMLSTLYRVLPMLEGSFALGLIDLKSPETLYCTRKGSPLIVGRASHGNLIASDIPAILEYSRDFYLLDELDIAVVGREEIRFYDAMGNEEHKDSVHIDWDMEAAEKEGYAHFMLKEIHQQPQALLDTFNHYVDTEKWEVRREAMPFTTAEARQLQKLTVVGCGTAYYAGLVGVSLISRLARLAVYADVASEYRYKEPLIEEHEAFVVISQSGETADTIAAMRLAKEHGRKVAALCNVIGSTIAREADQVLYTLAGPEIAVASTKAYTAQVMILTIMALDLARLRGYLSEEEQKKALRELAEVPAKVAEILKHKEEIQYAASRYANSRSVFFIGRLLDYSMSMEAALKLKEISYIHADAYGAGELKHGPIALIEDGTLVMAYATQKKVLDKICSNIQEVKVRGAQVITISQYDTPELSKLGAVWKLPEVADIFAPLLAVVPAQLFSYYVALQKGCDIDKPKNLAKSVTVE
ncbi:MAG: glutamine--fructose-6-phosphate transaminase (isomerizing) [Peptococcaceae bacterium]|nr:glutamine--fructose-6-phosphate transaminase (isomerizing) [Peptococcaceae bacterium]